jgi:hypothetical protein
VKNTGFDPGLEQENESSRSVPVFFFECNLLDTS